jgi:hypothetical protein
VPVVVLGLTAVKYDRQLAVRARGVVRWVQCRTIGGEYCTVLEPTIS